MSYEANRARVVALLYAMFQLDMGLSAVILGWFLRDFSPLRLVRVVQGAAVAGIVLNLVALWKQERVRPMSRGERAATALSHGIGGPDGRRTGRAAAGRGVPRHDGIQHAGRAAEALWR